jgi:hypothetical protein
MSKTKIFSAFSVLMLALLACNALLPAEPAPTFPSQPGLPATEDDVPRVPLEEALVAYSAGAAVFLDVRGADLFAASHIPGAINIPVDALELNPVLSGTDQDEWIITYCT